MTARQVLQQALQLPEDDRMVIANSLLDSVVAAPPDHRSDEEWLAEIERRARAALDGSPSLSWSDARARVEERLGLR